MASENENFVDLSRYDNRWYRDTIGASKFKQILWYVVSAVFFHTSIIASSAIKVWLLRLFGARVGTGVVIKPVVKIKYPWKFMVGDNTWIGEDVWIDNLDVVTLGDNVCLSQGAMLLTGNHDYRSETFDLIIKPITVESGAWVGAKAVVCPGVKCGTHAVLTVGSVASQDLVPYGIYRGNPAVWVKARTVAHT